MKIENKKIAFFAGSFDPFTVGHLYIAKEALKQDFFLIIGIGVNGTKAPWFSGEDRKAMIERILHDNDILDKVEVVIYTGLTGEVVKDYSNVSFFRGVRNQIDRVYEEQIAAYNLEVFWIPTIIIEIPKELGFAAFVSSSGVRELISNSPQWPTYIKSMVPSAAFDGLMVRKMVPILRERFVRLFERNGGYRNDALYCFSELVEKYSDPKRSHHGILHIVDLLKKFDNNNFLDPDLVELAIFYHDIYMDFMIRGGVNKLNSAKTGQYVVARYLHRDNWYNEIYHFVMLTRHPSKPETHDEKTFVALDLSILNSPPDEYQRYLQGIRYEYRFLSDEEWKIGRSQFLNSFMQSEYWKTDSVWQKYKKHSVSNIEAELKTLSIKPSS